MTGCVQEMHRHVALNYTLRKCIKDTEKKRKMGKTEAIAKWQKAVRVLVQEFIARSEPRSPFLSFHYLYTDH